MTHLPNVNCIHYLNGGCINTGGSCISIWGDRCSAKIHHVRPPPPPPPPVRIVREDVGIKDDLRLRFLDELIKYYKN